MSIHDGTDQKYSYKLFVQARKLEPGESGPTKAEIQAYINEVLGIDKGKKKTDGILTV